MRSPDPANEGGTSRAPAVTRVALLWLAGNGMRVTILAVPPLISLIHQDLHMSETQVGILTGLPVALFAGAAVPGSLLIARFGAVATVVTGLLITALGTALRGVAPDVPALYAATIVVGFGVAIMHPAMPPLARLWLPDRTGFATAVYANGLLIGEILPVLLMVPVVLPLVGGSWRLSFAFWAAPCTVIAAIIFFASPRVTANDAPQVSQLWWPDWSSGLLWRLGLILGGTNASYFTTNHFLPDYLHQSGNGDLVGPALVVLNIVQLPGSFLLLWLAGRFERRSSSYVFFGCVTLLAALGIILGNGPIIVASAGLIGFSTSSVLILILALPPLVSSQQDVPRMAAGMFTISYSCAVIVPIISGIAWDLTGMPAMAFLPMALMALLTIGLAPTLGLTSRTRPTA
ncbi:MAG TPA: MFS transporter [Xanthobacteraceae bacterium]|nr:MFS transporter [Xanthobacteraceae bacterium]